jgi:uncharacterized heparinase superfamily protein
MSRGSRSERVPLQLYAVRHAWRRLFTRLAANPNYRWRFRVKVPERLLIAPQDLRTGDPTLASEFYAGRFAFTGKVLMAEGRSPFELTPPSREWADALLNFGWLRHLRSAGTSIAKVNARALVGDWITLQGTSHPVGWQPEIVARRVICWLTQAPLILEGADHPFYRRFLRSLTRQIRFLRGSYPDIRDGYPRLLTAMALCFAGLCISGEQRLLRFATRKLEDELNRQILPDGGHISRNPGMLIEILIDLLPLRQSFEARNIPPPTALLNAIDRIMPMLRFFRHGDGSFAYFNGMGATPGDMLATVLAYDDARGAPVANAAHSGYQRMEAGQCLVIADTGKPPPMSASQEAHAGCLSFELSHARQRIVINCGMPAINRDAWRQAARATAAHSTVSFNNESSCKFLSGDTYQRLLGATIIEGPSAVKVARGERDGSIVVRASHDGYGSRYKIVHQRSWRLAQDGSRLDGEDVFFATDGGDIPKKVRDQFAIRFHLHPNIKASRRSDGESVLLALPGNESWLFSAGTAVELEESIFLPATDGPRRSEQIVVSGHARDLPRVVWSFVRTSKATRDRSGDKTTAELPL